MNELGASKRAFIRAAVVTLALLLAIVLVALGMWKLPAVFVDEAALNRADGSRNGPAIQAAYNAARVPIGVVLAALLAASAAAAGVVTTRKSIAVTQAGLDLTRRSLDEA